MTHPDTPELDTILQELWDNHLEAINDLTRVGPRKTPNVYFDGPLFRSAQAAAKASLTRLLAKRELEGRIAALAKHVLAGMPELTVRQQEYITEVLEQLREELAKYDNSKEKI